VRRMYCDGGTGIGRKAGRAMMIMTVAWRHCIASLACIKSAWHGVLLALRWDMAWLVWFVEGWLGEGAIYISCCRILLEGS
jgi:hypothetical protein